MPTQICRRCALACRRSDLSMTVRAALAITGTGNSVVVYKKRPHTHTHTHTHDTDHHRRRSFDTRSNNRSCPYRFDDVSLTERSRRSLRTQSVSFPARWSTSTFYFHVLQPLMQFLQVPRSGYSQFDAPCPPPKFPPRYHYLNKRIPRVTPIEG